MEYPGGKGSGWGRIYEISYFSSFSPEPWFPPEVFEVFNLSVRRLGMGH